MIALGQSFGFRMLPHLLSVKDILNSIQVLPLASSLALAFAAIL
jgi:hypothetical protein